MPDLFSKVTTNILENLVELSPEIENMIEMDLSVRAACGFDGNGNNSISRSCPDQDSSIIVGGIKIFQIRSQEQDIYVENSAGSETETPWFLIPSKSFMTFLAFSIYHMLFAFPSYLSLFNAPK